MFGRIITNQKGCCSYFKEQGSLCLQKPVQGSWQHSPVKQRKMIFKWVDRWAGSSTRMCDKWKIVQNDACVIQKVYNRLGQIRCFAYYVCCMVYHNSFNPTFMQTPRDNCFPECFDRALAGPKLKQILEAIYAEPCLQFVTTFRHLAHSYTHSVQVTLVALWHGKNNTCVGSKKTMLPSSEMDIC